MTPVPYNLTAVGDSDGRFSATLKYGTTVVGEAHDLKERNVEGWARATAQAHKAEISPAESKTKRTTIEHSIVL